MDTSERIKKIREEFFNGNNLKFSEKMEENPNTTSGWVSGKRGIGKNVLDKIIEKFPEINTAWLLTGEGEMLKNIINQNNIEGDNIQGNNVTVKKTETERFIDLLKTKDEQLTKSQIQIDRLIGIIEQMNKK